MTETWAGDTPGQILETADASAATSEQGRRPRLRRHVKAIIACPGIFAVLLPGITLAAAEIIARIWPGVRIAAAHPEPRWSGFVLLGLGLALFAWTNILFHRARGTLHPNDGPVELVTRGLYAWMRNPMIVGVFLILGGASLLLGSWTLAGYLAAFATAKNLYIALYEEPALRKAFGNQYTRYLDQTPLRWLPWSPRSAKTPADPHPGIQQ